MTWGVVLAGQQFERPFLSLAFRLSVGGQVLFSGSARLEGLVLARNPAPVVAVHLTAWNDAKSALAASLEACSSARMPCTYTAAAT